MEYGVDVNYCGVFNIIVLYIVLEKGNIIILLLKWYIYVCYFNSNVILYEWFNDILKRFVILIVM